MNKDVLHAMRMSLLALVFTASAAADDVQIELYAEQPIMEGAQLSPSGTHIAFLSSLQGRYHLVIEQFSPTFSRSILYPGEELDFKWVHWASDERLVLSASFSAHRGLAETIETRLFSIDPLAENLTKIIRPGKFKETGSRVEKDLPPPQIQDNVIDWLPDEPDHILVSVDSDQNGFDEVRKVDITNGKYDTVVTDFAGQRVWVTDQTGTLRIGWGYEEDHLVITLKGLDGEFVGSTTNAWVRDEFVPVAFTENPNVLLVKGPNESNISVIRRLDLVTDEFLDTVFEHENVDAGDIVIDDSNGAAVGVSYTEHLPAVAYFDAEMKKLHATINKALPNTTNRIASASKNRRQVLIFSYSDTNPGAYYIWDRDGKSLSHYSDRMANLTGESLSPIEAVSYEARDGVVIPAYLTLPRGAERSMMPTIIMPHGGPRADKSYDYLSQFLASLGYAVLKPNFRGSSGYGSAFEAAGNNEWGGKMQDDVTDGAQWLIDEGIADPSRLCIVGWSYGGYAAAMGAIKTPDLYQCAASINGILNLPRLIVDARHYLGGSEWAKSVGLEGEESKTVSPYHQAERISVPMLVIQAEDDARVHKDQGRRMADRLQELGKPVEYVEIEFGGHSVQNVEGRTTILKSLDRFLATNIGGNAEAN